MTETVAGQPAPAATASHSVGAKGKLMHLPLPLFAATMGLAGLGIAWREAAHGLGVPAAIGEGLLGLAAFVYVATLLLHGLRAIRHPAALAADLAHPVRLMFAGAVTIGAMLLAGALIPYDRAAALTLWAVAVTLHLGIGVAILRRLMTRPGDPVVLTPPLLIPLVGNVLAPVFGAKLGLVDLSWVLFGIGMLLWLAVQPLLFYRVFAGPELPGRLKPTLVIMLAPSSVGVVALLALTGGTVGPVHLALWGYSAILAAVFLAMLPAFARMPFAMSWWGWTFPACAFAIASMGVVRGLGAGAPPGTWLGLALLLAIATAVVGIVTWRTLRALLSGALLQPEH